MPSPDDVLRLRGVAQDVTEHRTVRRIVAAVDLVVHAGETVAVVGRSGTGKSTLLNVMGLLAEPAEGEVWVCGERSDHVGSRRRDERRARDIGFVFQTMNLVAHLDVVENVVLGCPSGAVGRAAAVELLGRLGLAGLAERRAATLSLGEQQRVAVARAVAKKPRLVLADEPTGSLDAQNEKAVLDLLTGVAEAGAAVVVVTHSPVVAEWADRVVTLLETGLLQEGSPA
ncbi:MAG: ATP-binding cassette domain-containing protein [Humibacillus sp.]